MNRCRTFPTKWIFVLVALVQGSIFASDLTSAKALAQLKKEFPVNAYAKVEVHARLNPGTKLTGVKSEGLSTKNQLVLITSSPCGAVLVLRVFESPFTSRSTGAVHNCSGKTYPVIEVSQGKRATPTIRTLKGNLPDHGSRR